MPIYEYECKNCGHEFEKLVLNNVQEVACPKCRGMQVTKQFSMFASPSGSTATDSGSTGGGSKCGSCIAKSCSGCG